ncbi:hypothetical protein MRB53_025829 [Persea americana]|uniref:Uncharacterized protein n=1 Tax=Persea americana TaxID=3435 RepID=A0ACC2LH49_PERAE|nr:hypothetical protein MRB53_025829 [Persea americana]
MASSTVSFFFGDGMRSAAAFTSGEKRRRKLSLGFLLLLRSSTGQKMLPVFCFFHGNSAGGASAPVTRSGGGDSDVGQGCR